MVTSDFRNLWAYTNRCTVEDFPYTQGQGLSWVENDNAINPEALFMIKFNKQGTYVGSGDGYPGMSNQYALHFGVRGGQNYANTFPFGQGWGAGPVAPNLVADWEAAEPNDPRRAASIYDVDDLPNYERGSRRLERLYAGNRLFQYEISAHLLPKHRFGKFPRNGLSAFI